MLDHEIDASTSVPFGDTFLIVGGKSLIKSANDIYFSDILEFNPTDETWITRPETVPNERSDLAALLVEDSILNCI